MRDVIRIAIVLELCLLILAIPTSDGTSTKLKNKKKVLKETKEINEVNICDIQRPSIPFYCYCDSNNLRNATYANCMVFDKFEEVNPAWNYFKSQIFIDKLIIKVIHNGNITYVPTQVLKLFKHLQVLDIQYGRIHKIKENVFFNLSSIAEISLTKNYITGLAEKAFNNMKNLNVINLDDNHIVEIPRGSFVNLPGLTKLMLNRNNITTIYAQAFSYLNYLQDLELMGNQMNVITRDMFSGLRSLQKLDLRNNLINMIGDDSFIEMPELQTLELDQNMIEYISHKALAGMKNLKKLTLSDNKLAALDPEFLNQASSVNFLDLSDNLLKTMTFDSVKPIVTNLYNNVSYFYLNGNKLICDCKLQWIWGLRNETKNIKLREVLEELTCFLESKNASLKSVKDAERNSALAIARNPDEYTIDNMKEGNRGNNDYLDDATNYEDSYDDSDSKEVEKMPTKMEIIDGKVGYMKHLFELKPEDLPCPEPSREDLMASEQPSSRHANAAVGSAGIFFFSSGKIHYVSQSVLALSFLVASRFFT